MAHRKANGLLAKWEKDSARPPWGSPSTVRDQVGAEYESGPALGFLQPSDKYAKPWRHSRVPSPTGAHAKDGK